MGILRWLNRLAGKADRKLEPTAATIAAGNAPTTAAPVGVTEIQKEEREENEA
jgi:hypothetical protein